MAIVRRGVHLVGDAIMAFVAVAILASMFVSTADVIGIRVFAQPVGGAVEGAAALMPVIVFVSLAYVQRRREHIRVEFLYARASPRIRAIMDVVTDLVVLAFFGVLAWQLWQSFLNSYNIREAFAATVRFPIWLPRGLMVLGIGVMILQTLVDLVDDAIAIVHPGRHHYHMPDAEVE